MRPTVIAHRGACRRAPENTVAAFELARELGSDWVEFDVRRTADGALAVHHDAALADGRLIVDLAASDLPPDVPGLGAALDACRGMGVNIEIKNAPVDADFDPDRTLAGDVVALLADRGEDQPVLVSSFDLATVDRVHALSPTVLTAWLTASLDEPAAAVARAAAGGHVALHPFVLTVDQALVDLAHGAGLAVNTWTVDDPDLMLALAEMGVDGIVTNVPDVAVEVLGGLKA